MNTKYNLVRVNTMEITAVKYDTQRKRIGKAYSAEYTQYCHLGTVVVSVLATGPKGFGFDSGQGDGFLRGIKTCSTHSFQMGSKAGGPVS
jgi:hypothetical protein